VRAQACPVTSVGELTNGLRYFVRSCAKPSQRAVLRLALRTGSIAEEEDQLGLAHFVEHTAFLKLRGYEKGELIKFIEATGSSFGADLNAHTSWTETVYKLNVPLGRRLDRAPRRRLLARHSHSTAGQGAGRARCWTGDDLHST